MGSITAKQRRTVFTDEKLAVVQKNIAKYAWAAEYRDKAVKLADVYLGWGLEYHWSFITSQKLPRSLNVNKHIGCPECGQEAVRYGTYPFTGDIRGMPWKIKCPNCGLVMPSNDFEVYYKSCLDECGCFDPMRGDKSLLVNTLYPEKGPGWCVDDGYGWIHPGKGDTEHGRMCFIACYNSRFVWNGSGDGQDTVSKLDVLKTAYICTKDPKYAVLGLIILDRIADVYPYMDISYYRMEDGYYNSHGGSGRGKVHGSIEETMTTAAFALAYDAFFDETNRPEIYAFLSEQAKKYKGLGLKNSAAELKGNIERNLLKQIHKGVMEQSIRGNLGMHQNTLATAAVVLDTPESRAWVDYLFTTRDTNVSGPLSVPRILANKLDRNGYGDEASPSYHSVWYRTLKRTADLLHGAEAYKKYDMYQNPKFRKLLHMTSQLVMSNEYIPHMGDVMRAGDPGTLYDAEETVSAFANTGDAELAKLINFMNGEKAEGMCKNIFIDCEAAEKAILDIVAREGGFEQKSVSLPGYGYAALTAGSGKNIRDLWMFYGKNIGHGHGDTLNIGIHGFGLDLTPDHGYPSYADINFERSRWTSNTISHNTVLVDRLRQTPHLVSWPLHYGGENARFADVEARDVYPQTSGYRRSVVMADIDEANSYYVDFFRIDGGGEYIYSFHGGEGALHTYGLALTAQGGGTLAGPGVPYASPEYDTEHTDGFDYLYDVERDANPGAGFIADWSVKDTWKVLESPVDAHVRLTMLTKADEAVLANGRTPGNKVGNPNHFRYVLAFSKKTESRFVSVIEPYTGSPAVVKSELVSVSGEARENSAYAVKVILQTGRVDYVITSSDAGAKLLIDGKIRFRGFAALLSVTEGGVSGWICDGNLLSYDGEPLIGENVVPRVSGRAADFTGELSMENYIDILPDRVCGPEIVEMLAGSYIYISAGGRVESFKIESAVRADGHIRLSTGDVTTIKEYQTGSDAYHYLIERGADFYIPLTHCFER